MLLLVIDVVVVLFLLFLLLAYSIGQPGNCSSICRVQLGQTSIQLAKGQDSTTWVLVSPQRHRSESTHRVQTLPIPENVEILSRNFEN